MINSLFKVKKAEDSLGLLLWQTTTLWQRLIKKVLDPFDISHTQFVIMAILLWFDETKQKPTQTMIARQSMLDKMTISKSLKQLALQRLIKRIEDKQDTRAKLVCLTTIGREVALKLVPMIIDIDHEFFGKLREKDQKNLLTLLNRLIHKS